MTIHYSYSPPEYVHATRTGLLMFRYRVPYDVKELIGKSELKYSLKTRCVRTARRFTSSILNFLEDLFNRIRLDEYATVSREELHSYLRDGISKARIQDIPPRPYSLLKDTQSNIHRATETSCRKRIARRDKEAYRHILNAQRRLPE